MSAPVGKAKILVAEEDSQLLDVLKSLFRSLEHRVKSPVGPETLADALTRETPDVLVCSISQWRNLGTLKNSAEELPPAIVIADYAELEQARQDVKGEARVELLLKPLRAKTAITTLEKLLMQEHGRRGRKTAEPAVQTATTMHFGCIIGEHQTMQDVYSAITQVAQTDLTVLIRGESGTGKDLVARAVHMASPRATGPFVPINCTSVHDNLLESELFGYAKGAFTGANQSKEGLFRAAEGGTIFLDEIGSIPMSMQLTLLRVLQDKTYRPVGSTKTLTADVRVVAATNENLEERIRKGLFREDLFFRLSAFPITLPPLRDRLTDVPLIAGELLRQTAQQLGRELALLPHALEALQSYSWPGNVRELQNVIRRTATTLPEGQTSIGAAALNLPQDVRQNKKRENDDTPSQTEGLTLKAYLKRCERAYLKKVYDACGHDKERTAKVLGISIGTFYRKLEE